MSVNPSGGAEIVASLTDSFGYNLNFFGVVVTPPYQVLALSIFTILLLVLNIVFGRNLTAVNGGGAKKIFGKKKKGGSKNG